MPTERADRDTLPGEREVVAIADAAGLRCEPLHDGPQQVASQEWESANLPSDLFWWWLRDKNDGVLIAVDREDCLSVSRPIRRVHGPSPEVSVTPATSKAITTRDEALDEIRRIIGNRRRSYRRCHFCGEKTPPEFGERTAIVDGEPNRFACHGCMSSELGVVF